MRRVVCACGGTRETLKKYYPKIFVSFFQYGDLYSNSIVVKKDHCVFSFSFSLGKCKFDEWLWEGKEGGDYKN